MKIKPSGLILSLIMLAVFWGVFVLPQNRKSVIIPVSTNKVDMIELTESMERFLIPHGLSTNVVGLPYLSKKDNDIVLLYAKCIGSSHDGPTDYVIYYDGESYKLDTALRKPISRMDLGLPDSLRYTLYLIKKGEQDKETGEVPLLTTNTVQTIPIKGKVQFIKLPTDTIASLQSIIK